MSESNGAEDAETAAPASATLAVVDAETALPASSAAPAYVTYAAAYPQYAKSNGASTRGPAGAFVAVVAGASALFFAL